MAETQELTWNTTDRYIADKVVGADDHLIQAQAHAKASGLPDISVTGHQGKFINIILKAIGAKRVLELGTLAGYSAIWMARALPADGKLVSLEFDPHHAKVAAENIRNAGLHDKVEIRVGAALDLLPQVFSDFGRTFDFVFIDANKDDMAAYFEWALKLTRPGGLIFSDNVVRDGQVADPSVRNPMLEGIRDFYDAANACTTAETTALQTVGEKGHDGFALSYVTE